MFSLADVDYMLRTYGYVDLAEYFTSKLAINTYAQYIIYLYVPCVRQNASIVYVDIETPGCEPPLAFLEQVEQLELPPYHEQIPEYEYLDTLTYHHGQVIVHMRQFAGEPASLPVELPEEPQPEEPISIIDIDASGESPEPS